MTKEIKLYSKTICGKCMFVKSQLVGKGIEYKEINLDHDEKEAVKLRDMGLMTAPVLQVDDEYLVSGKIMEFLEG